MELDKRNRKCMNNSMREHEETIQSVEEIPWSESSIIHDMYETDDN